MHTTVSLILAGAKTPQCHSKWFSYWKRCVANRPHVTPSYAFWALCTWTRDTAFYRGCFAPNWSAEKPSAKGAVYFAFLDFLPALQGWNGKKSFSRLGGKNVRQTGDFWEAIWTHEFRAAEVVEQYFLTWSREKIQSLCSLSGRINTLCLC